MKRPVTFISIAIISIFVTFLPVGCYDVQSWAGVRAVPSHHGYSAIDPSKNHFVVVGDTRGKNPWEFWRKKPGNAREDILDEIATDRDDVERRYSHMDPNELYDNE